MALAFGCKELVGDTRIGVLLLYERGDAVFLGLLEHRSAGISAHAYGYVGPEVADYAARLAHGLPELPEHTEVAPQPFTVKSGHGQTLYGRSLSARHSLHLHA